MVHGFLPRRGLKDKADVGYRPDYSFERFDRHLGDFFFVKRERLTPLFLCFIIQEALIFALEIFESAGDQSKRGGFYGGEFVRFQS